MEEKFGSTLRRLRVASDKTLKDVARHIGVSIVYLSDVERGNRRPLPLEKIARICDYLRVDPSSLITAAVQERGAIEINIRGRGKIKGSVILRLITGLVCGTITEDQLLSIQQVLQR